MTVLYEKNEAATFDSMTETNVMPMVGVPPHGIRIDVNELSRVVRVRNRGEVTLLDAVSFSISAGELVAIVGPSGAGKTTLLEAIAGVAPATTGSVRLDGIDLHANPGTFRSVLGYVPQDDIIHADLPLQRTLRYSARLRLPSSTTGAEVDEAVRDAIDAVGLTGQADIRVGSLSGGQRKRASIAVELLTDPHLFFLDEPTSGLDPVTSAELMARLRQLADRSATVVFTTHSAEDLAVCDRIVFMTRGGRAGFVGTVDEAFEQYGVCSVPELYRRLAEPDGITYPVGTAARRGGVRRRSPRREHAIGGERAHPVGCAHSPDSRDTCAQPLDARDLGRVTSTGRRHVRHSFPARRVRLPAPEPELDGDDRLLGRLRGLLLRAHVRLAPDLHGANDPAPRTPCRPAAGRIRGCPRSPSWCRSCSSWWWHARCASSARPSAQSPTVHVRFDRCRPAALRGRGARSRPAHLRRGQKRGSGDTRTTDAVLSCRLVLWRHRPRQPHGAGRRRPERGDPIALGLRSHRS